MTLLQRSESELARLVACYDAVLEAAIDGVLVTDSRGRALRYSRRFAELFGITDASRVGEPAERAHAVARALADPEDFGERTRQIIEGPAVSSCDELVLRDGRVIERMSSPIVLDHEVIGRVWFFRDITMRKHHEQAMRQLSEERHHFLFEASPLPIWVFDPKSLELLAVNEAMVTTLGYTRDELLAMTLHQLKPPGDIPRLVEHMKTVRPRELKRVGVRPFHRKDGSFAELDITAHSVFMGGRLVQLAIGIDVTETRRLEERLHQSQKLDAIGQLAGGVAHDFNNILAAILSNAEGARELLDQASAPAMMLREIEMAAERGASLTRQLLAFSRKQRRQVAAVDVNAVVRNIERLFSRVIGEHIEMTLQLAEPLPTVHADASQLEQVVMNLILNARDAMPDGGHLIIETANSELDSHGATPLGLAAGDYVVLSVTDTGIGMDADTRAHIFEPFFTTKEVGRGTGLGLATVFGIIQQSEGAISVSSEPGRGSTFRIYLPRIAGMQPARTITRNFPKPANGGRILLVEDDEMLRVSLERRLRAWGYSVVAARDPLEAIELARCEDQPIQLVLTDLVMPQMDGRTLANRILPARPATRVLFMSGYTQHAAVKTLQVDDREHFIAKPFTGEQLASAVRRAIRS
jgi:two-component system, cell cycle sensor histidine kinase and response regulator CckA